MAKISFFGLGKMGAPMAARLLSSSHQLTVWNRTAAKAEPLAEQGASVAASPAEAAAGADVLITMLATPDALLDVLFGNGGAMSRMREGQTLIEMSTVGPAVIEEIASKLPNGVTLVDAPVLGSVPAATDGTLFVFVGADDQTFDRVRPILDAFGSVRRIGGLGDGAAVKLVVNLTLGAVMSTVGEALVLARAFGLDRSIVLDVLEESPVGVTVKGKRGRIESGHYPANFKLALAEKDMRLVNEAAEQHDVALHVARAAREWFIEGAPLGPDLDYSAVIATILGEEPLP
jgi:3-hydroxyisobutyrate dehydrogenase-like beta-hydroxyacid dehydrogenase